ncbi:MAG: energy transducer TonB [Verrucomicrobia bacterium]|nr:energy transducer TonB [Verrucomicrobiota bacterium]
MNPDYYQRRLSYAMAASLLIHVFLLWFYAATPLTQALVRLLARPVAAKQMPKNQLKHQAARRQPPQLNFIEVDALQASKTLPQNPKFFSDRSSLAANPAPKNRSAEIPKIEGRKLTQIETTTVHLPAKTQPRPATPPPAARPAPKAPSATPARVETPKPVVTPKPAEGITAPEPQRHPKQQQPQQQTAAKTAQPAAEAPAEPQAAPQLKFAESSFGLRPAPNEASPVQRDIPTMASETDGGVARRGPTALNVVGMPQGAYSKKMFAEIGRRWTLLLEQHYADGQPGRVKLSFTLYPTGHVDNLKVAQNTASSILGSYCQKAVLDCAPFDPWPQELKLLGGDHLDITIDFNVYLYER